MDKTQGVTGALGYTGKQIAAKLLAQGKQVRTLTHSIHRENPFHGKVEVHLFHSDHPDELEKSLQGVSVPYNTYWQRFDRPDAPQSQAVDNTLTLFRAAERAGVERVVHIRIINPDQNAHLTYFKNKKHLEKALKESQLSYSILRPAFLFGKEDVLVNNPAWTLRTFPVCFYFGKGRYRIQPIHVQDLADLAVREGASRTNTILARIIHEPHSVVVLG